MDAKPQVYCAGLPLVEERSLTDGEWSEMQSRRRKDAEIARWLPLHAALLAVVAVAVCVAAQIYQGDPLWLLAITAGPFALVGRDTFYQERLKRYPTSREETRLRRFVGTVGPEYKSLLRILRRSRRSRQRSLSAEVETLQPGGALWSVDGFTASSLWSRNYWSEIEAVSDGCLTVEELRQLRSRSRKCRLACSLGIACEGLCVGIDILFMALFAWLLHSSFSLPQSEDIRRFQSDLVWQIIQGIIALPLLWVFIEYVRRKWQIWRDLTRELRNPKLVAVEGIVGRDGRPSRVEMFPYSRIPWTIDGVPAPWRFGLSWTPVRATVLRPIDSVATPAPERLSAHDERKDSQEQNA